MIENRVHKLNDIDIKDGPVIYWMSRDQRANDNWALIYAYEKAMEAKCELIVAFTLADNFLGASQRHFMFMLKGMKKLQVSLNKLNIPLKVIEGEPGKSIAYFSTKIKAGLIVCDFDPLRIKKKWKRYIIDNTEIAVHEVDAHNIVPCRIVSQKIEFAAYTLRPKIKKKLEYYLDDFPELKKYDGNQNDFVNKNNSNIEIDPGKYSEHPGEVDWLRPGEDEAKKTLEIFINERLEFYNTKRNNPGLDYLSNLSPFLHFGMISAQRIAKEVLASKADSESIDSFIEELVVRKELSDNFCHYCENYDNFDGFHEWAQKTLNEHRNDKREYLYSLEELENANTHDNEWNKAQTEMVDNGKMHGYRRMYWAKKILEWTESPEQAQEFAIFLNDKYELDGRDPNGYTGIAWSIGGVHDRAWGERPIFGKIRYMAISGIKKKYRI